MAVADNSRLVLINSSRERHETRHFCSNDIITSKYTVLTFLPKNLFEQFRRLANFYFLCLAFLHLSIDSPVSPLTSVLPLVFVITVTGVKQAYEDWLRHREDNKVNNAPARVLREGSVKKVRWRDIAVGDIVEVADGEEIPADLLLLAAEDQEGKCVVTTANLDGETNLKTFLCPDATRNLLKPESLWSIQARVQCQLPHANLYDYKGVLEVNYQEDKCTASLATQNLLLRGAKLRHTPRVYGVAVYTGKETKMALNSKLKSNKFSTVERSMNYFLIFFLFLLILEVALCTILKYELYSQEVTNEMWYIDLPTNATVTAGDVYQDSVSFLIIFSYIIPISLYVTLEMQKFLGTMFMSWDEDLRGAGEDEGARVNTSDLNEELGQVQYLFTDKTGTLTENIMHFRNCSADGAKYSDVAGKIQALDEQTNRTTPLPSLPVPLVTLLETLALCHTVQVSAYDRATAEQTTPSDTIELSELKHYQASSPDEKALVEACARYGVVFEGQNNGQLTVKVRGEMKFFTLLQVLEFDSDRKCMSVVIRNEADRKTWLLTKGAESSVLKRCLLSNPDQQRLHDVTLSHINDFAMLGLRTLAVARRELTDKQYEDFAAQLSQAKQVLEDREEAVRKVTDRMEADLTLLGATGVEDLLQDGVQETLESLRVAGIKVWVLTGDKVETAVNIAYSCGHFKRFMTILTLTGLHDKETADRKLQECREACHNDGSFGLVVDGQSLVLLLEHFEEEFYAVGRRCWSVVCCRMSPKQKAEIVHMAKTSREHPICAAIGDGANDVSMIQEAHVGLGIMGKEGRQAVRCSDFGFAKFRFLKKMLLVHGHWNYVRVSVFVQFSFYKNVAFNTPIVFYSIWNAFSTQSLYESLALTAFNITFTSLPVLVYGLFEQNIPPDILLTRPHLYQRNANNVAMSWLMFLQWNFFALWHAAAMFFGLWLTCWDDTCGLPGGATQDLYLFGLALGTLCTFVTNMKIVLEANFYNVVLFGALVITTVGYAVLYLLYSGIPVEPFIKYGIYAAYYRLFESPSLNLGCLVVGIACLLPDFVMKVFVRTLDPEVKLWARGKRTRKELREEILMKVSHINEAYDADDTSVSPDRKPEVL
ncbi:probable phospholipid-transporting ATPase IF isoform X1 [Penaeus monodon]|uniref:probable phospholipid-transporting ATPase IF isoform X1 n=1 Tax=Penaeus monodon TaxID=6687 RepID=UPI0018A74D35|nr:probable phospholipid-transporting ATPase IF isoform X1 [Penaeus monodon]